MNHKPVRERMCCPLRKYAASGIGCDHVVQLTECVDQEDVKNVSCPAYRSGTCTRVEFLRNLFGETEASDWRNHGKPELHEAVNLGLDQIDLISFGGPEVNLNCLP